MSGHGGHGGGHRGGHVHLGSLLLGAWMVSLHRWHRERHKRHHGRRKGSPILRHKLSYSQAMTAAAVGRAFGIVMMIVFFLYYAHTIWQIGGAG